MRGAFTGGGIAKKLEVSCKGCPESGGAGVFSGKRENGNAEDAIVVATGGFAWGIGWMIERSCKGCPAGGTARISWPKIENGDVEAAIVAATEASAMSTSLAAPKGGLRRIELSCTGCPATGAEARASPPKCTEVDGVIKNELEGGMGQLTLGWFCSSWADR